MNRLYNAVWRFGVFLLIIVVHMYDIVLIQLKIAKVGVCVFFHEAFHHFHVAVGFYHSCQCGFPHYLSCEPVMAHPINSGERKYYA